MAGDWYAVVPRDIVEDSSRKPLSYHWAERLLVLWNLLPQRVDAKKCLLRGKGDSKHHESARDNGRSDSVKCAQL